MTAKEIAKKVFTPPAIMVVVMVATYGVARLLGADYVTTTLAALVVATAAFAVAALVVATAAFAVAAFVFAFAAALAFLAAAHTPVVLLLLAAAITLLVVEEKDTTKKQKALIVASYLIEFAIIFSAFQFVLPTMF